MISSAGVRLISGDEVAICLTCGGGGTTLTSLRSQWAQSNWSPAQGRGLGQFNPCCLGRKQDNIWRQGQDRFDLYIPGGSLAQGIRPGQCPVLKPAIHSTRVRFDLWSRGEGRRGPGCEFFLAVVFSLFQHCCPHLSLFAALPTFATTSSHENGSDEVATAGRGHGRTSTAGEWNDCAGAGAANCHGGTSLWLG